MASSRTDSLSSEGALSDTTKTGAPRRVPLHEVLAEALKEHRAGMMAACHPAPLPQV